MHTINMLYLYFFYCCVDHRDLHSFPTRRSSDLGVITGSRAPRPVENICGARLVEQLTLTVSAPLRIIEVPVGITRSEEHTSELQSLAYLVCRLLLEKKKLKSLPPLPLFLNFLDI